MYEYSFFVFDIRVFYGLKIVTEILNRGEIVKMKNVTRQVLILKNFSSPEIQQAIIILKNPLCENETKIVAEAEMVIDAYLEKRRRKDGPQDKGGAALAAVIALGMFVTGLAVYGAVCLARLLF